MFSFFNSVGEEAVPEQDLMAQWFSLVNEKNALVRFESELMAQAWELELEDRHSHLEQEIRTRLAVDGEFSQDKAEEFFLFFFYFKFYFFVGLFVITDSLSCQICRD